MGKGTYYPNLVSLSLIPGTHIKVEEEKGCCRVGLSPPHTCCGTWTHAIHTEIMQINKWALGRCSCLQESSALWVEGTMTERNSCGVTAYPVSSPCRSTQGSTDRSHRWGCRSRCWHRNRAGHSPAQSVLQHTLWAQGSLASTFFPRL